MRYPWRWRLLSLLLTCVLVLELVPAGALAARSEASYVQEEQTEEQTQEEPGGEAGKVVGEATELREESEKHFRLSNGGYLAVDYGGPVHYETEDGFWAEIDNTLVPVTGYSGQGGTQYIAVNGDAARAFAGTLGQGQIFTAADGAYQMELSLWEEEPAGEPTAPPESIPETVEPTETTLEGTEPEQTAPETTQAEATEASVPELTEPVPVTVPETGEATEAPETSVPPETLETVPATMPEPEQGYNRASAAQIAGVAGPAALSAEEEPTLEESVLPKNLQSTVLYPEVYPGVDLQYELYGYHIKESILVKEPRESYRFTFRLNLAGLTPELQEDGSIELLAEDGTAPYWIPAPYLQDSGENFSQAAFYTLEAQEDGTYLLTVEADPGWMNEGGRAYPVCIDPTFLKKDSKHTFEGSAVGSLKSGISDTTNLACGYHPDNGEMQIFFKFSGLPTLEEGSVVTRAWLGLYQNDYKMGKNGTGGQVLLRAHALTQNKSLQNLTWGTRPNYGPVLDYTYGSYSTINKILQWDITPAVKQWYTDSSSNYGLAITSNESSGTQRRAWFSYANQVLCLVEYRNNVGVEPYYTYQTMGAENGGTVYLSDYTGQLTVTKELLSYASGVNPFSLNLVYNTAYFQKDILSNFDVCGKLGLGMHLGSGVQLDVIQHVAYYTEESTGTRYIKYRDGDGTTHFFAKDAAKDKELGGGSTYYYDEDGLGLKITEYAQGYFKMSDDTGNLWYFANGFLIIREDANGNKINIHYKRADGSTSTWYPSGSGDRIEKICQQNQGCAETTIATFTYATNGYLTEIQDAAGNKFGFSYSNYKLRYITRNGGNLVQFGLYYHPTQNVFANQLNYLYDEESDRGIAFTYENGRVASYQEVVGPTIWSAYGAKTTVSYLENGQTLYRYLGADRTEGGDDTLTYYSFDYAGRTVNAYSTNAGGELVGASNAAYTGVGDTTKSNNRTLRTAAIGVAAMNELRNGGFESGSPAWSFTGAGGTDTNILAKAENPRTGVNGCKGWIRPNKTNTIAAYRSTDTLAAGGTYTLSAYVNTSQCTYFNGGGVYLQVTGNGLSVKSESLNYTTDNSIDGGWARLSVTFTAPVKGTYTIGVYNHGAGPYFFADDFQLERQAAPSNRNLLENGNYQYWGYGWTLGSGASFAKNCGVHSTDEYAYSMLLTGHPSTDASASQTVQVGLPGTETYVLSGWAKANAVPDNEETASDPAQDKNKQFGLRAVLSYTDGSKEYHYGAFNPDLTDWQFTSLTIVPKQAGKTVTSIQVVLAYEKNENKAWFDNISLVREAAQTMKYDKDGNLVSVQDTGNKEETSQYQNGNLIKTVTGGNGTYTYDYDSKHNLTKVSNGVVQESLSYDGNGNVTGTTLAPVSGGTEKITSSTTYTNEGNLVGSATSRGEFTTTYSYAGTVNKMTGQASSVTSPTGVTTTSEYDNRGRVTKDALGSQISLGYTYAKGLLSAVSRTNGSAVQKYNFTYDTYGNLLKLTVGSRTLMSYSYESQNGQLSKQTYGNGDWTSYTYDELGRTTGTRTSDGDAYTYVYTGDGQLHSMTDNQGTSATGDDVKYSYRYDGIGRLVGTEQRGPAGQAVGAYQYDESSRVTKFSYSIPGVIDSATESFYYNSSSTDKIPDGALTSMAMFSDSWLTYTYDSLSRLSKRDVGNILSESYGYLAGKGTCTTTPLVQDFAVLKKGTSTKVAGWKYTYNALGNITKATDVMTGDYRAYSYDNQGQLQYATDYASSGTAGKRYKYYYDAAGNLTSWKAQNGAATVDLESHTYTYGNSDWKDLLTAFDGHAYSYDTSGNPLSYYNGKQYTMSWRNGRELDTMTVGGKKTSYQYDVNGLRTKKTNPDGSYTQYYIVDGLTVGERWFSAGGSVVTTLRYLYDENRSPVGFGLRNPGDAGWTNFYFAKNLQGDVTAVYRSDASSGSYYGTLVAAYTYDPYGQVLTMVNGEGVDVSGNANSYARINPFRYRGYYQDNESGFYYLQSRYYDPEICRFINADSYASTGQGFLGSNMFAYCNNNPVSNKDSGGEIAITALILIGSAIFGLACAGYTAYKESKAGYDTADIVFDSIANGLCGFCSIYTLGMSSYECYLNFCALNAITPVTEVGGAKAPTPSVSVYGTSQAPKEQEPNSLYNKVDNVDGTTVVSTTKFNSIGKTEYRIDYYVGSSPHTHFDKATQTYLYNHIHYFWYNDQGLPCGNKIVAYTK